MGGIPQPARGLFRLLAEGAGPSRAEALMLRVRGEYEQTVRGREPADVG